MRSKPLQVLAAYEDDVHPENSGFWEDIPTNHPYAQHPLLSQHGESLARQNYEHTEQRGTAHGLPAGGRARVMTSMDLVTKIEQLESGHEAELEQAAKQIVSQIYGISLDKLQAHLVPLGSVRSSLRPTAPVDPAEYQEPTLKGEVDKRVTLNTLTHGAAVHGFMTAHHLADESLETISPELKKLYDQLAAASHQTYFTIPMQRFTQQGAIQAGESYLEKNERGQFMVIARATTFPVLIQELIKGTMELLSLHGMNKLDHDTYKKVTNVADNPRDEAMKIQVGPALWRKLVPLLPRGQPLGKVMVKINQLSPDDLHELLDAVVSDPDYAKHLLSGIFS